MPKPWVDPALPDCTPEEASAAVKTARAAQAFRDSFAALDGLVREVAGCGVEHDDDRMDYLTVQAMTGDPVPGSAACRSTMFGDGCGHPVIHHDGDPARACCCCNRKHNLPDHRATCLRCQAIDKAASRG